MRAPHGGARHSGSVLVYSWQPVRELTGTDGARHAGMAQRLLQVVRSSCRLQLQVYYISGQAEVADTTWATLFDTAVPRPKWPRQ